MSDKLNIKTQCGAMVIPALPGLILPVQEGSSRPALDEQELLHGHFHAQCRDANGDLLWDDEFDNTVVTIGKNLILDTALAGSAYTVVGPFMGLISSVSFTGILAADTMSAHSGWTEAGATNAPTYTSPRPTCAWSAASGGTKSLSASLSFAITGTGTIKGAFIVFGSGAVSTLDSTAGTLLSAGLFTGGDQSVVSTNTVNVSYSLSF